MQWPPPVPEGTRWENRRVRINGTENVYRLRTVHVGQTFVQIDEQGNLFCEGCQALFTPAEVLKPGSGHLGGRFRRPVDGMLLPLGDD